MIESAFEGSYSVTSRVAAVRAATIVMLYGLPKDARGDLEQEALLELWRKHSAYDARRGSWRTFSERVVANRMASLIRHRRSARSGQFREGPLDALRSVTASDDRVDLRVDVWRVLAGVSQFDRSVAVSLMDHSAVETSRRLRVSRAAVYRSIARLRAAFTEAGLSPLRAQG